MVTQLGLRPQAQNLHPPFASVTKSTAGKYSSMAFVSMATP